MNTGFSIENKNQVSVNTVAFATVIMNLTSEKYVSNALNYKFSMFCLMPNTGWRTELEQDCDAGYGFDSRLCHLFCCTELNFTQSAQKRKSYFHPTERKTRGAVTQLFSQL